MNAMTPLRTLNILTQKVSLLGREKLSSEEVEMSCGTNSREHSWTREEVFTYRQHFKYRTKRFFVENYKDARHIMDVWKVDRATAENWRSGISAPQSWVIGLGMDDPVLSKEIKKYLTRDEQPCEGFAAE